MKRVNIFFTVSSRKTTEKAVTSLLGLRSDCSSTEQVSTNGMPVAVTASPPRRQTAISFCGGG